MKSLGANHSRHLSDTCDPTVGPQEPLCPLAPDPHAAFLLSPTVNHYTTLDPHLHHFPVSTPTTLQSDCLLPLNNQLTNSSTFPRLHYTHHFEIVFTAAKMNRLPANLLDQLERHLPLQRDGFSTLQFHRCSRGSKQRSESPSRIRNLVQSVQKLFAKSQSMEVSAVKGSITAGPAGDAAKATQRSKSKDRAKTEGTKRRPRPNLSGFWSSDDGLEDEPPAQPAAGPLAVAYRNPLSMMTLGRAVSDSQAAPRPHPQGYNTIAAHSLKSFKSSGDLKPTVSLPPSTGQTGEHTLVKRGSWSTLTLSQARQVLQKGSTTVNRTLLKSKSCHGQEMTCNFLQVPAGDWSGTLGKGGGGAGEIPCRRMRSGSYVKAMGDTEDSDDSDGPPSPKPSPKTAARRQSYLKATQRSLSEQQPPPLLPLDEAGLLHWDSTPKRRLCLTPCEARLWVGSGRLPRRPRAGRFNVHMSFQVEQGYRGSAAYSQLDSQAVEALDLPTPTCFRSRSHSYLRAIQAGCSQDDDTGSVDSDETPPITSSISGNSKTSIFLCFSVSMCTAVCKKNPPPIPPRTTSKPYISVTVQSSTESAQDTYLDSQDQRSEVNSQSGRSNSSDSIASSRTGMTTPPPAIALPSPAPDTKKEPVSLTVAPGEPQVDCVQPILKEEQTPTTRFQSIGVQVEDGRLSRFTSMASRQETTEAESQEQSDGKPSENKTPNRSLDGCSVHKPPRASASLQEKLDPALDPSSLPPPDPSLQAGSGSVNGDLEQPGGSACLRDGRWFQKLLQAETDRMEAWCQQMDQETKDKQLSEDGEILTYRYITSSFTVQSIPDGSNQFSVLIIQITEEKKSAPSHTPKKTVKVKPTGGKERGSDSLADKQRQEARKRLMAAKRAVSERQNSATESAESIEIYVPEAQTRL
uniref:DLG associated protein 4 n=1 Tax=Cyprinus carpio TaxID=7962 RepID=A0A8C1NFU4_CYPCA